MWALQEKCHFLALILAEEGLFLQVEDCKKFISVLVFSNRTIYYKVY